ncbi:MAG: hypothetical protein LBR50_06735, partial [Tannerella sp.]|jgi:hypothetical protein|nr:hypothetical protein [Tannerella sp.]
VIYIDGPDVSAAAPVVADKVWVDDNGVIITSSVAGKADIYSVSGLLIGSLPLSPGATITKQLPKGFYIVSANGKAYKIVVK